MVYEEFQEQVKYKENLNFVNELMILYYYNFSHENGRNAAQNSLINRKINGGISFDQ